MRRAAWMLAALMVVAAAPSAGAAAPATSQPTTVSAAEAYRSGRYDIFPTQENLNRIDAALHVPETRMEALRALIAFAGPSAYQVGSVLIGYSDGSGDLRDKAAQLLDAASDDATIQQTLNSPDRVLVFWGIQHFQGLKDPQASIPILKRIAQGSDETLRSRAVFSLRMLGELTFVKGLAPTEKSPYVLSVILPNRIGLDERLCDLLKDPDASVRTKVIAYLRFSWIGAESVTSTPLMDALLRCAQSGQPDADAALAAFRTYADQNDPGDADATAKWWSVNRSDWEFARIPRSQPQNGPRVSAFIVTTGQVGGTPPWDASIILENRGKDPIHMNFAKALHWFLYDANGQIVPSSHTPANAHPVWVDLQPGQSITQASTISLQLGAHAIPGRYLLRAWLDQDSGQISLPAITVEVVAPVH
jgi:hypothetical protein